jgi:hypothetical protein
VRQTRTVQTHGKTSNGTNAYGWYGQAGSEFDTGLDVKLLRPINTYWEATRSLYAPFESQGLHSGNSDVYEHEMPGGQCVPLRALACPRVTSLACPPLVVSATSSLPLLTGVRARKMCREAESLARHSQRAKLNVGSREERDDPKVR